MSRALVISGGGSKGAFAAGVIKSLLNEYPNLHFDMFVGTSTGSLMIPLVALGETELLEEIYTTRRTTDIIIKNRLGDRLNDHSIFDATPLWKLLETIYTEDRYNALVSAEKRLFFTTTCLQTSELVVFTTDSNHAVSGTYETQDITSADHFRKVVMASACQPVFMPPVKVNKNVPGEMNPYFQYVDGGVKEYAGIQMAIDNGATEIFTIILSSAINTVITKTYDDLFSVLQQTIELLTDDVGNNDLIIPLQFNAALAYIDAVKKKMEAGGVSNEEVSEFFNIPGMNPYINKLPLKLFIIRPALPLGGGSGGLEFDPEEMKGMVRKGEAAAGNFIASLNPGDITWG